MTPGLLIPSPAKLTVKSNYRKSPCKLEEEKEDSNLSAVKKSLDPPGVLESALLKQPTGLKVRLWPSLCPRLVHTGRDVYGHECPWPLALVRQQDC